MTMIFYIYIFGFGVFAFATLQTTQCKKSPMPLLCAIIAGGLWPIALLVGSCIGFYRAMKDDLGGNNKAND